MRLSRSARRHRIGKARALYVMRTTEPVSIAATGVLDARLEWVGKDERGGFRLQVVALDLPGLWLVIHVQPLYRGR